MKRPECLCRENTSECEAGENKVSENTDLGKIGMHLVPFPKLKVVLC